MPPSFQYGLSSRECIPGCVRVWVDWLVCLCVCVCVCVYTCECVECVCMCVRSETRGESSAN